MAAGTVAYTDTTGNKDYLGIIAGQIGRRLKEASDMASDERDFAENKAELGGTSLSEAGIDKGYFFKRALGSRFGGDKIARTRGRMGATGPGTSPTGNFKTRFRGGFDYNVSNEIQSATAPVTGALATGLRGVEGGLVSVSQSLSAIARGMENLARAQEDAARQAVMNGAFMQAFLNHMQREGARQRAGNEERGLERRGRIGGGVGGRGRGMINVTPPGGAGGRGGGSSSNGLASFATSQLLGKRTATKTGAAIGRQLPAAVRAINSGTGGIGGIAALTKAATSEQTVSAAGKMITGDVIPEPLAKSIDDIIPGMGKASKIFTGDSFRGANLAASTDAGIADAMAKAQKQMSPDAAKLLDDLMYGEIGSKAIKQKDAAQLFEFIKKGGYTGQAMSSDEVLDMMKQSMGDVEYNKLMNGAMKGADKPIAKQLGGTVAEQTIKQGLKLKAKAGGKSLIKKLPLIGAIAGVAFGIERALKGDLLGAGLEITSGLLGMAPGIGSGLGLGIDGFLLARDMGAMPMAKGGFLTKPTPVVAGEAGAEGFFPLEGARGKKTFKMFGEGVLNAQKDNKGDVANLYALGNKKYYEGMGGWKSFGEALKGIFTGLGDILPDNPLAGLRRLLGLGGGKDETPSGSGAGRTSMSMNAADIKADTPEEKAFIATVRELEGTAGKGGYNTWYGGRNEMDMTSMTIQQVHDEQTRRMNAGETTYNNIPSAAVGAGQFMEPLAQVKAMFASQGKAFDPTKVKFTKELQNQLILDLAKRKRGVDVSKPLTVEDMKILGGEWASFTPQHGQTSRTAVESLRAYDENLGEAKKLRPTSSNKGVNLLDLFSSSSNPDGAASALNGQSGMFSMGSAFTMPTTIVNNYNTVAGGSGSGGDDSFSTGFPSFAQGFIVPYSMDALK